MGESLSLGSDLAEPPLSAVGRVGGRGGETIIDEELLEDPGMCPKPENEVRRFGLPPASGVRYALIPCGRESLGFSEATGKLLAASPLESGEVLSVTLLTLPAPVPPGELPSA